MMFSYCGTGEDSWESLGQQGDQISQSQGKSTLNIHSVEGLMIKLKLQSFGHLIWRANSLEKTLMLGKIEGKRRRGQQRMRLDSVTDTMDMNFSKLQEITEDRGAWHATWWSMRSQSQTWLSNGTTTSCITNYPKTQWLKNNNPDFPGGPAAKTLGSQCRGPRLDPWSGN